jgi:hypothetical protein
LGLDGPLKHALNSMQSKDDFHALIVTDILRTIVIPRSHDYRF